MELCRLQSTILFHHNHVHFDLRLDDAQGRMNGAPSEDSTHSRKFVSQPCKPNILEKNYEHPYLPSYGLNSITAVLEDGYGIK